MLFDKTFYYPKIAKIHACVIFKGSIRISKIKLFLQV